MCDGRYHELPTCSSKVHKKPSVVMWYLFLKKNVQTYKMEFEGSFVLIFFTFLDRILRKHVMKFSANFGDLDKCNNSLRRIIWNIWEAF